MLACWRVGDVDYVMMQVRPDELARMKKKHPDTLGMPTYYAIVDDDVDWWPSSKEGGPSVVTDRDLPPIQTGYSG